MSAWDDEPLTNFDTDGGGAPDEFDDPYLPGWDTPDVAPPAGDGAEPDGSDPDEPEGPCDGVGTDTPASVGPDLTAGRCGMDTSEAEVEPTFAAPASGTLLDAARLALAILGQLKVPAWADLPLESAPLLTAAGIVLSDDQRDLLDNHSGPLGYIRRRINKKGDTAAVPQLTIAVCPRCQSWRLVAGGTGGSCVRALACKGTTNVATPMPTSAAAARKLAKAQEASAAASADTPNEAGPDDLSAALVAA